MRYRQDWVNDSNNVFSRLQQTLYNLSANSVRCNGFFKLSRKTLVLNSSKNKAPSGNNSKRLKVLPSQRNFIYTFAMSLSKYTVQSLKLKVILRTNISRFYPGFGTQEMGILRSLPNWNGFNYNATLIPFYNRTLEPPTVDV